MKKFRYVELDKKPYGVNPKYKIGDLIQMVTHADWSTYSWVSSGSVGLVCDMKFFIQESYDPTHSVKYVTEYRVEWIHSGESVYLDESMMTKLRREDD